jgi:hypothetical protein
MIFYWYWEAMLVSYLSARVTVLPFNSIAQMVRTSEYRLYVDPGSAHEDVFKYSTDPVMQEAWTKKIEPYMEEYKANSHQSKEIELAMKDPTVVIYEDIMSVRYYFSIIFVKNIQYFEKFLF